MQHEGQKQIVDICTRDFLLLHGFQDGLQAAWMVANGLPQVHGFCFLQGKRASITWAFLSQEGIYQCSLVRPSKS